ncbi:hypothetical protein LCGC14_2277000, partial [marine sediment metagenome]
MFNLVSFRQFDSIAGQGCNLRVEIDKRLLATRNAKVQELQCLQERRGCAPDLQYLQGIAAVRGGGGMTGALPLAQQLNAMARRRSAMHGESGFERRERDSYFTESWVTEALLDTVHIRGPV